MISDFRIVMNICSNIISFTCFESTDTSTINTRQKKEKEVSDTRAFFLEDWR